MLSYSQDNAPSFHRHLERQNSLKKSGVDLFDQNKAIARQFGG